MKTKPMEIRESDYGGMHHVDLLIERDSGNPVLILFGKKECSLPAWKKLRDLCNNAINIWEDTDEPKDRP